MELFNLKDILDMEKQILLTLPQNNPAQNGYFKESVAQYLYDAWFKDNTDTRIIEYSLPLIQSLMIKKRNILKITKLEMQEIFQELCIGLLNALPKYNKTKGKLFTYFTLIISYRIYDLVKKQDKKVEIFPFDEEIDAIQDYSAIFDLDDFIVFLKKMKNNEGKTANTILDAFIHIINNEQILASQGQDKIISRISVITKLPDILIKPYYARLLEQYIKSDLPY